MIRVVYTKKNFRVLKTNKDFIIVNDNLRYENHSHFKRLSDCKRLIDLILRNKLPYSKYWAIASKRLLSEEEFNELIDKKKMKYRNRR